MSRFDSKAFAGLPTPTRRRAPTREQRVSAAESLGFRVRGDSVLVGQTPGGVFGGSPITRPLSEFDPFAGEQVTALDQAGAALGADIDFLREEVQQPFQQATDEFGDFLGEIEGVQSAADAGALGLRERQAQVARTQEELVGGIREASGMFSGVLDALDEDLAQTVARAESGTEQTQTIIDAIAKGLGDVSKMVQASIRSAESAITNFRADVNRTTQAVISGLDARVESQSRLIAAGVRSDGTPMSEAEKRVAQRELRRDTGQIVAQTVASVRDEASKFIAGLRTNLANVQMQGAGILVEGERTRLGAGELGEAATARETQTRLSAAELRSRVGLEVGARQQEGAVIASQVALGYEELRSNLENSVAGLMSSGALQAVQLGLQGRQAYADMIRSTPYISLFEGLAAMMAVGTAPGGRRLPGFTF